MQRSVTTSKSSCALLAASRSVAFSAFASLRAFSTKSTVSDGQKSCTTTQHPSIKQQAAHSQQPHILEQTQQAVLILRGLSRHCCTDLISVGCLFAIPARRSKMQRSCSSNPSQDSRTKHNKPSNLHSHPHHYNVDPSAAGAALTTVGCIAVLMLLHWQPQAAHTQLTSCLSTHLEMASQQDCRKTHITITA